MEMRKEFILPDFSNSNLNISATLAEFLGAPNKNPTLPMLKEELAKNYKNVVFICFDGMGVHPLKQNLSNDNFLIKNIRTVLTSTFPSTTTNATNSILNNKLPMEHGWFGWSMHFADINKNIDIFLNRDSWSGEPVEIKNSPLAPKDYYFDNANSEYSINTVFPGYVEVEHKERNYAFETKKEFFENIERICKRDGKQFVYAYYPDPDHTMHEVGVTNPIIKQILESISKNMQELQKKCADTLFIVTADHGQVDIEGYVELYNDKKLMNMLKIYPFLEARAPAFLVKDGYQEEFEKYFREKYSEDFVLYKSKELIDEGLFGKVGNKQHLLGDYIAIGTKTHKQAVLTISSHKFKGHHTSLTEEMLVPLIILSNKQ